VNLLALNPRSYTRQRALRAISMVSLQNKILALSEKNQREDKESYARMASMRKVQGYLAHTVGICLL
jgi:hypothetical protein